MTKDCAYTYTSGLKPRMDMIPALSHANITSSGLEFKSQAVQFTYAECTYETFTAKSTKFVYYRQRQVTTQPTLVTNIITTLFNSPTDTLCAIKEWFISDLGTTTRANSLSVPYQLTKQATRASVLGPLEIDRTYAIGSTDFKSEFSVSVYLREIASKTNLTILHPRMANIEVNIGCFNVTQLSFSPKVHSNENVINYDPFASKLTMKFPQKETLFQTTFSFSQLFDIVTEFTQCTAYQVTSFRDAAYLFPTTADMTSYLVTNPWNANSNYGQPHIVTLKYGVFERLPLSIYIQAETNGVVNTRLVRKMEI